MRATKVKFFTLYFIIVYFQRPLEKNLTLLKLMACKYSPYGINKINDEPFCGKADEIPC